MRIAAIRCIQRNKFGFLDLFSWGAELSNRALNCSKAACISSGEVDDVVSSNSSHKENNNFLASTVLEKPTFDLIAYFGRAPVEKITG